MELISIEFLKLEPSRGGIENIIVIVDYFTRFAQAIPCRNQTAAIATKVETFLVVLSISCARLRAWKTEAPKDGIKHC